MIALGLMDGCLECPRHMLCVMGRPEMLFCAGCRKVHDADRTYDCPHIARAYPNLVRTTEDKLLDRAGIEGTSICEEHNVGNRFYAAIRLTHVTLGWCKYCSHEWGVEMGRIYYKVEEIREFVTEIKGDTSW
jgi:hypothetical protein